MLSHRKAAWLLWLLVLAAGAARSASLAEGFRNPPPEARPSTYFLLLNGYLNRASVEQELAEYQRAGVSGICLFDMGARGDARHVPPAGPPFLSRDSVDDLAHVIRAAGKLGMEVSLSVTSSWDLGGSWVKPEDGSMTLRMSRVELNGPTVYDAALPFSEGTRPPYYRDVAVLAIPEPRQRPGYEFVYELPEGEMAEIERVALYNTQSEDPAQYGPNHLFAKEFTVSISTTDSSPGSFHDVLAGTLTPREGAQEFRVPRTRAKYIRLLVKNGHNTRTQRVELAEFEAYTPAGVNVLLGHSSAQPNDGPRLLRFSSELGPLTLWSATNLNDGRKSGPRGSWSSAEWMPLDIPDHHSIVDLTRQLDATGRLRWTVPPGRWVVLRYFSTNTGERLKVPSPNSDGLATDHLDAGVTRRCLQYVVDRLKTALPSFRDTALKALYLSSYEVQGQVWSPTLLDEFRRRRGYDFTPFLPILSGARVNSDDTTARVRYDFDKTLGEVIVDNYYRTASDVAREAGVGIESEAGGPGPPIHRVPVDALQAQGAVDFVRGEFWPYRPEARSMWVIKETASAAHIYGKPRVNMEAFTSNYHWQEGPAFLKAAADRAFCEGMNHVVWHTASHQPPEAGKPGWVYGAGTHLGPTRVWWPMAKPFLDYLGRASYLLQQGQFVADILYYYGDQGYNFVRAKRVDPSLGPGFDYDVVNQDVLLHRLEAKEHRLALPDGMHYEVLVLPERTDIDLAVLQKVEDLVRNGATVIGPKPTRTTGFSGYPDRDRTVRQLAAKLWGDLDGKQRQVRPYGQGKIVWGLPLREVLRQRSVEPDFQYESGTASLDYIHRQTATEDIYFVRNRKAQAERVAVRFRASGVPQLWSPDTGEMSPAPLYTATVDGVSVPLDLAPEDSIFVVVQRGQTSLHAVSVTRDGQTIGNAVQWTGDGGLVAFEPGTYRFAMSNGPAKDVTIPAMPAPAEIAGAWTVSFTSSYGRDFTLPFPKLISWTDLPSPDMRFFSGTARYESQFTISPGVLTEKRRIFLDAGDLWAVAQVHVNGKQIGTLWKQPYRLDISNAVHAGENRIAITVANDWINRLIGDAQYPEQMPHTQTNGQVNGQPWAKLQPLRSGLFGPVRLRFGMMIAVQ